MVTVPSCLEILLTHGVEDPFWAHKLKYVIFDEVHSIGSDEGDVWERLLLLIQCPCIYLWFLSHKLVLALSATIGNFQELYNWLAAVEKSRGRKLYPIVYSQRYNDLVPFVFKHPVPISGGKAEVSDSEKEPPTGDVVEINTGFAIDTKYLAKYGNFQRDFKLLPRHLMQIYQGLMEGKIFVIGVKYSYQKHSWGVSFGAKVSESRKVLRFPTAKDALRYFYDWLRQLWTEI